MPWVPFTMNLEGLEMIAVLVVLVLFVKVLEQFGLFEPVSLEGNLQGTCGVGKVALWSICTFMADLRVSLPNQ